MLRFQAGGELGSGMLYVERGADRVLPELLRAGEFAYVLAPRQIGKSSLRARTQEQLRQHGIRCATIDLTSIGSKQITPEEWYFGLIQDLSLGLQLSGDPADFWTAHRHMSTVHRWSYFLRDQVLKQTHEQLVIFIDEIEAMLSLPFSRDDFFASIRAVYNLRSEQPDYRRLTFCLLGVALPGDLIGEKTKTPFNIGQAVLLEDFNRAESLSLLPGLRDASLNPEGLLDAILEWTEGHPYMTQRLCQLLAKRAKEEQELSDTARVQRAVEDCFLKRGRVLDGNLAWAEKSFSRVHTDQRISRMLRLYGNLIARKSVPANGDDSVQMALRLAGMAAERQQGSAVRLRVRNRIFATVFNEEWVKEKEAELLLAEPLTRWLDANRSNELVLRGQALVQAQEWARGRELTPEESEFIFSGLETAHREEAERRLLEVERARRERVEATVKLQRYSVVFLTILVLALSGGLVALRQSWEASRILLHSRMNALSARAATLARQPGMEEQALIDSIKVVAPSLSRQQQPPPESVDGLIAAVMAKPAVTLKGHSGRVWFVSFSPDGKAAITATNDGTVTIWNVDSWTVRQHMEDSSAKGAKIYCATFSPDGKYIVTAHADHFGRIWEAASGKLLRKLAGHTNEVHYASFSPDGKMVVTASDDHTARVWDAGSGQWLHTLAGHTEYVVYSGFSSDGKRIATASYDRTVRIWEAESGRLSTQQVFAASVHSAVFSSDGNTVLVASLDKRILLWDLSRGSILELTTPSMSPVFSAVYSRDERKILGAGQGQSVYVLDSRTGQELLTLRAHSDYVHNATFSPDGRMVLSASWDNTAQVWDIADQQKLLVLNGHTDEVFFAEFSSDGKRLVTASADGTARIWSAEDGKQLLPLRDERAHRERIRMARLSPDGTRVITASEDYSASVWDAQTGQHLHTLKDQLGHRDWISSIAFSPNGRLAVTASEDFSAAVWDTETGQRVRTLKDPELFEEEVFSAAFSHDARYITTGSGDKRVRVWDAGDGRLLFRLSGHQDNVYSAAFSPDDRQIVSAGGDKTIRLWDFANRRELRSLTGHSARINSAVYSPDGKSILSASHDHTARVWNASSGQEVLTFRGHLSTVYSAAFSPDGSRIITASEDKSARLFPAAIQEFLKMGCRVLRFQPKEFTQVQEECSPYLTNSR